MFLTITHLLLHILAVSIVPSLAASVLRLGDAGRQTSHHLHPQPRHSRTQTGDVAAQAQILPMRRSCLPHYPVPWTVDKP